jgi:hypothetical protein
VYSKLNTLFQPCYMFIYIILGFIIDNLNCYYHRVLNDNMINEYWIGKDVKGNGHRLTWGAILAWRAWEKPQTSQVEITSLQAEIWTLDFHNMQHRNINHLTAKFSLLHNKMSNDIYRAWSCTLQVVVSFLISFKIRCTALYMCDLSLIDFVNMGSKKIVKESL